MAAPVMAERPAPQRILVAHNRYREPGGEDSVFANEVALLRSAGYEVETLELSNHTIGGAASRALTALGAVHNPAGQRLVADALARLRPDVLHVHNFFPQLSPALFRACAEAGVPAVWTLHNFRIACANGLLFRDGQPCEDCLGRTPLPAILHRCYRGSALGSAATAAMIGYHHARGTWRSSVARFIALSEFGRTIAVRAGLPPERVVVKPNFVADPLPGLAPAATAGAAAGAGAAGEGRSGAVYVGRLSAEKGVATLIEAWRSLPDVPLTIIGEGPQRAMLEQGAPPQLRFLGFQNRDAVMQAMAAAQMLVVPSLWYENFPMTVVEAMALGTPVIASRIGALETLIDDHHNGLHFTPGDAGDLARVVRGALAEPALLARLGRCARETWRETMSPQKNLDRLLEIYRQAMAA